MFRFYMNGDFDHGFNIYFIFPKYLYVLYNMDDLYKAIIDKQHIKCNIKMHHKQDKR